MSLGATNGDLFSHLIAFSPSFGQPAAMRDLPPVFVSHGLRDRVLPIKACSRKLVPRLRAAGLDVTYFEFDGGYTIPTDIGRRAFAWFLGDESLRQTRTARTLADEADLEST